MYLTTLIQTQYEVVKVLVQVVTITPHTHSQENVCMKSCFKRSLVSLNLPPPNMHCNSANYNYDYPYTIMYAVCMLSVYVCM